VHQCMAWGRRASGGGQEGQAGAGKQLSCRLGGSESDQLNVLAAFPETGEGGFAILVGSLSSTRSLPALHIAQAQALVVVVLLFCQSHTFYGVDVTGLKFSRGKQTPDWSWVPQTGPGTVCRPEKY
jgi:hypothetical protein